MTDQQKKYIADNYGRAKTNAIAATLNVSPTTVLRWAKRMGMQARPSNKAFRASQEQINFILENYGEVSCKSIAHSLGISVNAVRSTAAKLGLKITKSQLALLKGGEHFHNPNPITHTTHMLICRYYYEGSSILNIACTLGRTKEEVSEILNECMENGNYIKYNIYGR